MEKRIVEYIIRAEADPAKLAKDVSELLKNDYQPYGSLCENGGGTVWQAMVKYGPGENGPEVQRSIPTPMDKGTEIK